MASNLCGNGEVVRVQLEEFPFSDIEAKPSLEPQPAVESSSRHPKTMHGQYPGNAHAGFVHFTPVHILPDTHDMHAEQARVWIYESRGGGGDHGGGHIRLIDEQCKLKRDR